MTSNYAEVAVIGGGIIGLASAYELAVSGVDVVVFERRGISSGTTGGSAGVVCRHDLGELYAVMTLMGYDRVVRLSRDNGLDFHRYGSLYIWADEASAPKRSAFETAYGSGPDGIYHSERLTPDQARRRFPWLPADGVAGAAFSPNQGFINPYELVDLYARLAVETGRVRIFPGTPVLAVNHDGASVTELVTRRGPWRVGTVVNATGPWGGKVAALAGRDIELVPQRIQVVAATGYDDGIERMPLIGLPEPVDGEHLWCRGEEGGMVLFGQHHNIPEPRFTVDPDFADMSNDDGLPEAVANVARKIWQMPTARFLPGWNCIYGMTPDGYPLIGPDPVLGNLIHALGCNGHGITMHLGFAMSVVAAVRGDPPVLQLGDVPGAPETLEVGCLSPDRFASGGHLAFDPERPTPTRPAR